MNDKPGLKILLALAAVLCAALLIQGCGGSSGVSTVSGTVADINRNTVTGADVWVETPETPSTESLASGAYRIDNAPSGWQTVRARATIDGETWVGSTAAEILRNEPTMNINIVLSPLSSTTEISGTVTDDTGRRVSGARVFLTTRTLYPADDTSSFDGPYGSIVAVTDSNGRYLMEDVPAGIDVTVAASKVGFRNQEIERTTTGSSMIVNFNLVRSNLSYGPDSPELNAIEAYTMPETVTRSGNENAYKAVRAFTSERYRKSLSKQTTRATRATPDGSLIEIDLYWNAIDLNDSRDLAGYGIYRATSFTEDLRAIDFVRDPYANFYGDTGNEITPNQNYYYAVSTVDVQFLDQFNNPDPVAESDISDTLTARPLGQLSVNQIDFVSSDPVFSWRSLSGADWYAVYVYSKYPTLPLDPSFDYGSDPAADSGVFPIWPRTSSPNESTITATSIRYNGPALTPGHTYYWLVLAGRDGDSNLGPAYSYSEIRSFTAR